MVINLSIDSTYYVVFYELYATLMCACVCNNSCYFNVIFNAIQYNEINRRKLPIC